MKTINIRYLYFDDKVCGRCKDTEAELKEAIAEFSNANQNVRINLEKKRLSRREIEKSPTILVDGKDMEALLSPTSEQQSNHCEDCSCLTGKDVSCRSYGEREQLTKDQILTALESYVRN
jgi:predicted DsbA family dithiol-disulfide isomerase